jgi:hypothetical protein
VCITLRPGDRPHKCSVSATVQTGQTGKLEVGNLVSLAALFYAAYSCQGRWRGVSGLRAVVWTWRGRIVCLCHACKPICATVRHVTLPNACCPGPSPETGARRTIGIDWAYHIHVYTRTPIRRRAMDLLGESEPENNPSTSNLDLCLHLQIGIYQTTSLVKVTAALKGTICAVARLAHIVYGFGGESHLREMSRRPELVTCE